MREKDIFKEIIVSFQNSPLPFFYKRELKIPFNSGKIISIIGPRRSGKTYFLFQIIADLRNKNLGDKIIYINFEDERIKLSSENLQFIIEAYTELYPDVAPKDLWFFFDEIQNVSGWDKFVRRVFDNYSKNIFLTGSNSKLLSKEISTSLRGRTVSYELFPLSFKEFLIFNNFSIDDKDFYDPRTKAKIKKLFTKYLIFGGFPELVAIKDEKLKIKVLQEYFNVMLYRDLIEKYDIKNTIVLKYFLKRIIETIGKPLSVNKIYNELKSQGYKIGKMMLYEFLDMAESSYFILLSKKYSFSVLKTEFSQKKAYIIDNGMVNAMTFSFKNNFGKLLENLVARELINNGNELFYYKNATESDFIFIKENSFIPIQVSLDLSNMKTKAREIKVFKELKRKLGIKKGYIITLDQADEIEFEGVNIKVVPAFNFLMKIKEFI